jgi:hypothetical protein
LLDSQDAFADVHSDIALTSLVCTEVLKECAEVTLPMPWQIEPEIHLEFLFDGVVFGEKHQALPQLVC